MKPSLALLPLALAACGPKSDTGAPPGDTAETASTDTGDPPAVTCADGGTGDITDPATAVHVWADAPAGGDGTWAHPFATLDEALAVTRARSTDRRVALWPGTYAANARLSREAGDDDLAVLGCGPDEVVLDALDPASPVLLVTAASNVQISGLCTAGGTRNLQVWSDASARLSHLRSEAGADAGIVIQGRATTATLEDVVVQDPVSVDGGSAYGIAIQEGATVTMTGGGVWGATAAGILVDDANTVAFSGITVEGTPADADLHHGHGLQVQADTVDVAVENAAFLSNMGAGVFVLQGLTFQMSSSTVDGTSGSLITGSPDTSGDGVVVSRGEGNENPAIFQASFSGNTVSDSTRAGIVLDGVTATLDGNTLSGNGEGDDLALAQDDAVVGGFDAFTALGPDAALALDLVPLAPVDPGVEE